MNIGNPHAVFIADDLDAVDLTTYGSQLQKHPLVPQEANTGVAQLIGLIYSEDLWVSIFSAFSFKRK
jgi:diaminopimelate epimerase